MNIGNNYVSMCVCIILSSYLCISQNLRDNPYDLTSKNYSFYKNTGATLDELQKIPIMMTYLLLQDCSDKMCEIFRCSRH